MFPHLSIRYKLTLLLVGIVSVVLLAVSVAIVVSDVQAIRGRLATRYATLATVVAANSAAALSFADIDPTGAQEVVSQLAVERSILFAALYNQAGTEIARYQSAKIGTATFAPPDSLGPDFTKDGFLDVVD